MKIKIDSRKLRKLTPTKNVFLSLAGSIIYQQISTKAGDSIYARFLKLFGRKKVTPENFLKLTSAEIKSAGISAQKAKYLQDLAEKCIDGTINPKNFYKMTDQEIKTHLVAVKGVGSWTADMFLIFALNRPDILPLGDLGIKKGFQKAFRLRNLPDEKQMLKLAFSHKGEYTKLALHLWGILDGK